jgi:foldase protein PrsA
MEMNKLGKKIAVAGICACLAMTGLTGCGAKEDKVLVKVDDATGSYGLVNFILRYNQAQMQSLYGSFMGEDMWSSYGETAKTSSVESLEDLLLIEAHMEEYGVSLSDEDKTKISDAAKAFMDSNEEDVLKAMSATTENVERFLSLTTIQSRVYDKIIAEADTNVSDEEAAQKTVEYVLFSTGSSMDEEGNSVEMTDEEKAEKKEKAEKLLEAVKGGQEMAEALTELGEDRSPTTSSYGADNGYLADEVKEAADKLEDGQVADSVIETDGGYYVVKMVTTFDEEATERQKETILAQRKSDHYSEVLEGWKAEAKITTDSDLLKELTFDDTFQLKIPETEAVSETENVTEAAETESEEAVTETEVIETESEETVTETETTETESEETATETESETK